MDRFFVNETNSKPNIASNYRIIKPNIEIQY